MKLKWLIAGCLLASFAFSQAKTYTTLYPPIGGPYKYQTVIIGQSGNTYNPNLGAQSIPDSDVIALLADGWTTINPSSNNVSIPSTADLLKGNSSGGVLDSGVNLLLGTFTASGCSNSTLTGGTVYLGGATVASGNFKAGVAGTCTVVFTFSSVAHNWACWANDITGQIVFTQTAQSSTTCTVSGAATTNDFVTFIGVGT